MNAIPRVGCAGWTLSRDAMSEFPRVGTHLERYAARFSAAEINSSFYRPHKPQTYARWAVSVPDQFRFSVKIPKTITHELRLVNAMEVFDTFMHEAGHLGAKLGCLLVQLPPKLDLDVGVARAFFRDLRRRTDVNVAIEPRHETWFTHEAGLLLAEYCVSRAAADPALTPVASEPGGFRSLGYYRLHGSPRMYYSSYSTSFLEIVAQRLHQTTNGSEAWCVFDNTASGAAIMNALELTRLLQTPVRPR